MNRFFLPEISPTRMSIKERLSLRKTLDISANELELLELVGQCGGMSLQKMADELGLTKRGVDKSANRLIGQGHLLKIAGKLTLSQSCLSVLDVEQSSTKSQNVEQSYTTYTKEHSNKYTENVEQSYTKDKIVELSYTNPENVEQSTTNSDSDSHTHSHGGNSILLNNFFETLKEEKNKEEKINPPNPLDKKQETKKEERRVRRQNRAARVMICGLMLNKAKIRKGKRLKRLPKRKPVKIINIPFEAWWDLYDRKVGHKGKLEKKWGKLSDKEREAAMEHTPRYVKSTPNKTFRKHPATYLNNQSFYDEIIEPSPKNGISTAATLGRIAGTSPKTTPVFDIEAILAAKLGEGNQNQAGFTDTTFEYVD